MAYFPPTGSVVAFQSDPTKLVGTVSVIQANQSVSGTINVGNLPTTQNVSGSVFAVGSITALQGTNPWTVTGFPTNQNVSGSVVAFLGNSTNASVITVGQAVANQSVSGTVNVGNFPTTQNISGSVFAVGSITALQGTNPWFVQLTSGSVITTGGNSSVMLTQGTNTIGSVAAIVSNFPTTQNVSGSVFATGSITALQGTNPWQVNHVGGGSIFTGFRNDAVASTVGVDLTSRLVATDSAGRTIIKHYAPSEARVQGVSSTVNTISTSLIAAAGAGLRNYLTNVTVANTGSVATLVTFQDGDNSVIGRTIAPGGGGSNIIYPIEMRTNGFNQQIHYTAATAVSVLHVSGYGYKAP